MKKFCLGNLQYLLLAILVMAVTGCGASNLANLAGNSSSNGNAATTAKLVYTNTTAKGVAKAVASVAVPASFQVLVTGSDNNGKPLPLVRVNPPLVGGAYPTSVSVTNIYPGKVSLSITATNSAGVVDFEGYITDLVVNAGATSNAGTINMYNPTVKASETDCQACHVNTLDLNGQNLVANYKKSGHYFSNVSTADSKYGVNTAGCAGCHGPSHNDPNPDASGRCFECHDQANPNHATYLAGTQNNCGKCHTAHNFYKAKEGCVGCHSITQSANLSATDNYVNDNNGVRSITQEFSKWSHHVTGVTLDNAHCVACHLEGKIVGSAVVVDPSKHMNGPVTHLRNVSDDSEFTWDPAAPNHTNMDNFCMKCHSAAGATSPMSGQIQAYINNNSLAAAGKVASPTNPFGDTISNRYDKMQRPAVTDVNDQFNTSNNSHHGVKGPRYSGRTRAAGLRQIASASTFANNSSALLQGVRSTIYDAGNFNALYVPLGTSAATVATTGLGDDSTLHCGDCHTVGEWKAGVATNAAGQLNTVAIGAHGSNNEYLLRNNLGTDERHTQSAYTLNSANNVVTQTNPNGAFLVCYNCHAFSKYGSTYVGTGADAGNAAGSEMNNPQSHAGEYDQDGRCNGTSNTLSFAGYTTGKATDGTQFLGRINGNGALATGEQNTGGMGNIFGIQCLNCHNSGIGNAYGGIHGSANNTSWNGVNPNASVTGGAYIDGMGNTNKVERFLPGLGNAMHVPGTLGGFTGGTTVASYSYTTTSTKGVATVNTFPAYTTGAISSDTNWEQKQWKQADSTMVINYKTGVVSGTQTALGAGCYTLGTGSNIGVINNDPNSVAGNVTAGLAGPSVTGPGGSATSLYGTWGGCEDHSAQQGAGNHGFLKRVVRPVTY